MERDEAHVSEKRVSLMSNLKKNIMDGFQAVKQNSIGSPASKNYSTNIEFFRRQNIDGGKCSGAESVGNNTP